MERMHKAQQAAAKCLEEMAAQTTVDAVRLLQSKASGLVADACNEIFATEGDANSRKSNDAQKSYLQAQETITEEAAKQVARIEANQPPEPKAVPLSEDVAQWIATAAAMLKATGDAEAQKHADAAPQPKAPKNAGWPFPASKSRFA